eukprot:Gb_03854 [translate_table: standard]
MAAIPLLQLSVHNGFEFSTSSKLQQSHNIIPLSLCSRALSASKVPKSAHGFNSMSNANKFTVQTLQFKRSVLRCRATLKRHYTAPPAMPSVPAIFALAASLSRAIFRAARAVAEKISFAHVISRLTPNPQELAALESLKSSMVCSVGPLFFAAISRRGPVNTPLAVVAAGMAKWLELYSGVLMVRVLLSWFPNIPWDRQPLSAIRDLCDPYLNLFRNIIPPVFNALDLSPLLAFLVLGFLTALLNNSMGSV